MFVHKMILKVVVCLSVFHFGCLAVSDVLKNNISTDENDLTKVERPCRIYDMFCIRQYFVKHSHCKEVLGQAPDPLIRSQATYYVPRVNLTVTTIRPEFRGINGRVVEFHINKKTDNLVLAVQYTDFSIRSNENYFRFHRRGKEPIVTRTFFNATYPSFEITIVIPNLKDLQLQNSEVFLYSNDLSPILVVGPEAFVTSDPQTVETLVKFQAQHPSNIAEGLLTNAAYFIGSFIQYSICDFGIEIF